ncbi:hypothetical protein [Hydrococcus rivularis]|uniref:hypothetical protein n=1 Tax=Hydrococcus rivularis TaxID=1616834 RepID=UPI000AB1EEDD|nr:hypothetical protein [Hydrococcus rivularis]
MWIVCKQVGLFTHYLTPSGTFQPGLERASKFVSQQMAEIMAKKHGGVARQLE